MTKELVHVPLYFEIPEPAFLKFYFRLLFIFSGYGGLERLHEELPTFCTCKTVYPQWRLVAKVCIWLLPLNWWLLVPKDYLIPWGHPAYRVQIGKYSLQKTYILTFYCGAK